ncbi:MAG TPA: AAA family ATPase [Rubricoccaceae bacterium]|jgi:hypothetical protein
MILKTVRIENFKSIHDTEEFSVGDVTCLVGKNESGKTAVLTALAKLKPVVAAEGQFGELEFPRMTYFEYTEEDRPNDVLTTSWELDEADIAAVTEITGEGGLSSNSITVKKGHDNKVQWNVNLNYDKIVQNYIEPAGLWTEESEQLKDVSNVHELIQRVSATEPRSERQEALHQRLQQAFPSGSSIAAVQQLLSDRLPTFLYFGSYAAMDGSVSLNDIAARKASGQLKMSDWIFEALLEMAGTSVEDIQSITQFEPLVAKLEAVSNRLTRQIFKYWSQNKHLSIDFRFDAAKPDDPFPFNSGFIFRTRIKNERHGATVPFDDRSTGFVWFFSFLVWFSQVKERYPGAIVLLLDEPGLNLHAKAQADLLRYMNEQLAPHHQVLYTTHSPFMIDPGRLLSVRTVEDVVRNDEVLGTKVSEDVLATDRDTLFPLQAALGYEIAQTLFVGEHVVLVEGPSDVLYLQWASDLLRQRKRTPLDRRWVLTPAGSIDKISGFVSLFVGKGVHVAALTDYGQGDKGKVHRLRESDLLRAGHVLTVDAFAGQPEADIEDVLGRPLYVELLRHCYGLSKGQELPAARPADATIRVVKEAERHFASLPDTVPEFDHYSPARYLVEHSAELVQELPGLDDALNRFEAVFVALNKLLNE